MKAAIRKVYDTPSCIQVSTIDKPIPGESEILIKVKATTVNRTDGAILLGNPFIMRLMHGLPKPSRLGIGTDFAGVVEQVGSQVSNYKVGDRVWGFNDMGLGSQAEYFCLSEKDACSKIPDGISFHDAAASAEGAHYAINFINKVPLNKQHNVLVYGATGAIGSAMVQLIKAQGSFVTAIGNTPAMKRIKVLGADKYVDYLKTDFTKDEIQYDFVFDAVGKSSFSICKPLLNKNGIYISSELGKNAQNLWYSILSPFFIGKKVKFPFPSNIQSSLDFINPLLQSGQFKPLIDRIYDLEQIQEAYEYVLSGKKLGNVILNLE